MKTLRLILAFAAFMLPAAVQAIPALPQWKIVHDKSSIQWAVNYGGTPLQGSFPDFDARIYFDPAYLDYDKTSVKISLDKVTSNDPDVQNNLLSRDWLNAPVFPNATFQVSRFTALAGNNQYMATGDLILHGTQGKLQLPFTLTFYDDDSVHPTLHYAVMDGQTTLKRLDYNIGLGDFARADVLGDLVTIKVHVLAQQVP